MAGKQIAIYGAVFTAGVLAVVGYLGLGGPVPFSSQTVSAPQTEPQTQPQAESLTEPDMQGQATSSPVPEAEPAQATTAIGEVARNTMVTVSGTVQRVTDEDEFVIEDATGSIPVWTGNQFFTVDVGESVTVSGFVDDDLLKEIYAQEIIRADGSVVLIGGSSDR